MKQVSSVPSLPSMQPGVGVHPYVGDKVPFQMGSPSSTTVSSPKAIPAGHMVFPGSPASGPAANFLPKLMSKLTTLDDKIEILRKEKLDCTVLKQFQEQTNKRDGVLSSDLRQAQTDLKNMEMTVNQLVASQMSKASAQDLQRTNDRLQDLANMCRAKADGLHLKEVEEELAATKSHTQSLQIHVDAAATKISLDQLRAKVEDLAVVVRSKADREQALHLEKRTQTAEANLDELQRIVAQTASMLALDKAFNQIQDLNNLCRGKGDLDVQKGLVTDMEAMKGNFAHLTETVRGKTSNDVHDMLRTEVSNLTKTVRGKTDSSTTQQLQSDLMAANAAEERLEHFVKSQARELQETKVRVGSLQNQASNLSEMTTMLAQAKADIDKVPQMDLRMIDQL